MKKRWLLLSSPLLAFTPALTMSATTNDTQSNTLKAKLEKYKELTKELVKRQERYNQVFDSVNKHRFLANSVGRNVLAILETLKELDQNKENENYLKEHLADYIVYFDLLNNTFNLLDLYIDSNLNLETLNDKVQSKDINENEVHSFMLTMDILSSVINDIIKETIKMPKETKSNYNDAIIFYKQSLILIKEFYKKLNEFLDENKHSEMKRLLSNLITSLESEFDKLEKGNTEYQNKHILEFVSYFDTTNQILNYLQQYKVINIPFTLIENEIQNILLEKKVNDYKSIDNLNLIFNNAITKALKHSNESKDEYLKGLSTYALTFSIVSIIIIIALSIAMAALIIKMPPKPNKVDKQITDKGK